MVDQEGFQRLAEVMDEMKPLDDLHGVGCPPANALGVQITPIAAHDRNEWILDQPGRYGRCGACRAHGGTRTSGPSAEYGRRARPRGGRSGGVGNGDGGKTRAPHRPGRVPRVPWP
jgi:hypothetical protein